MEKMDSVQILETIQEESEQEDETVGSSKAIKEQEEEGENGKLETPVDVETEELLAENERAEDDVPLKVLRPGRRSGSMRQKNPIQGQFREQRKETGSTLVLNASTHSTTCEAAEPMSVFENKRRFSEKLKIKVSKINKQKQRGSDQPKKKKKRSNHMQQEPFPQWLVNLMVNIEEATTHQLVVE